MQEWTAARICYCFRFFDDSDCNSFRSALEAMKSNRLNRLLQQQAQQIATQQRQAAGIQQQKQQLATTGGGDVKMVHAATDRLCGGSSAAGHCLGDLLPSNGNALGMSHTEIKDTIKVSGPFCSSNFVAQAGSSVHQISLLKQALLCIKNPQRPGALH